MDTKQAIGITDPDAYYKGGYWSNLDYTIQDTNQYDKHELRAIYKAIGMRPLRILVAGCAAVQSVYALAQLLLPGSTLVVVDLNAENMLRMQEQYKRYRAPKHTVIWQCADLFALPGGLGGFEYIRMDYTQNFVPVERQVELLLNLKELLVPGGRIGSIAEICRWTAVHLKERNGAITNSFSPSLVEQFIAQSGMTILSRQDVMTWEDVPVYDEYDDQATQREQVWTCCFFSMQ